MTVYKLVNLKKDGNCYPLFIDKNRPFLFNEWMKCKFVPTGGFAERSVSDDEKLGGWHCCYQPVAPHLSETLRNGQQRVWIECESKGITKRYNRPESQGGAWILVEYLKPIRILSWNEVRKLQGEYNEKLLSSQPVLKSRTA